MYRLLFMSAGAILSGVAIWFSAFAQSWPLRALAKPDAHSPNHPAAVSQGVRKVIAEGRLVAYPGADVVVGTEVEGLLVALSVQEKSSVKRGQLIAELRSDDLRAELAEAEAKIAESESDIRHYEREVRREQALQTRGVGATHLVDGWKHSLEAAQARRLGSIGVRDKLLAKIDKTRILAPINGMVIERHADTGEVVGAGAKLVTIVDLDRLRIESEVDEYDSSHVELGDVVRITAEGYGDRSWQGRVEEIPDSVTARRLRPEDPGRPIDARVLAVKVAFTEKTPLRLGQRVEVAISNAKASIANEH